MDLAQRHPLVNGLAHIVDRQQADLHRSQRFHFDPGGAHGLGGGRADDLRRIVQGLTQRGVRMEFVKEGLKFTGEDSPMANLMLSVMGAFAEFERALIRERQREGIVLAKQRGAYRGRKKSLNSEQIAELKRRVAAGDQKTLVARDFGISRETLYQYLRES